jgi:superfamily II DNA/RNA helicase
MEFDQTQHGQAEAAPALNDAHDTRPSSRLNHTKTTTNARAVHTEPLAAHHPEALVTNTTRPTRAPRRARAVLPAIASEPPATELATTEPAAPELAATEPATATQPAPARQPVPPDAPTFAQLGARDETVAALADAGIVRAFAIQEYALPIALRQSDLIGQAPTGTGKTLAFAIPILETALAPAEGADGWPQALVVVPTRELGLQVARDIQVAGRSRGVRVLPVYGGVAYEPQIEALTRGVEVIVGTPGRLLDLARPGKGQPGKGQRPHLRLDRIRTLVLDEADRMLDLGFLDDVEKILAMVPEERHTMLFSATMPDPIAALARRFLRQPVTIRAQHPDLAGSSPLTKQVAYRTHSLNKPELVARILQAEDRGLTMIFTRTKRAADRLAEDLDFRGFAVAPVHGDLGQGARERALRAFRNGKIDVLVATDVAARGLDVFGVTHVINYDCPEDADTYTHRTGRTGRAGATGVAVTFVDWEDMPRWRIIDKTLGLDIPEPAETYHTSAHLIADLSISESATGTLPSAERTRAGLRAEHEEDLGGKPRGRDRTHRGRSERPVHTPRAHKENPTSTPSGDPTTPRRRRRRLGEVDTSASIVDGQGSAGAARDRSRDVAATGATEATAGSAGPRRRRRGGRGRGGGGEATGRTGAVES